MGRLQAAFLNRRFQLVVHFGVIFDDHAGIVPEAGRGLVLGFATRLDLELVYVPGLVEELLRREPFSLREGRLAGRILLGLLAHRLCVEGEHESNGEGGAGCDCQFHQCLLGSPPAINAPWSPPFRTVAWRKKKARIAPGLPRQHEGRRSSLPLDKHGPAVLPDFEPLAMPLAEHLRRAADRDQRDAEIAPNVAEPEFVETIFVASVGLIHCSPLVFLFCERVPLHI